MSDAPRIKAARQNLSVLLQRLREQGVSKVKFHPDGRLAFVSFAQPEVPEATKRDPRQPKQEAPHIARARQAFAVIQGTADPKVMEED